MGNKGTKGVKGGRGSKSNKGPSDDLNDKDDLPAQRRRSKSAPAKRISTTHDRKTSTGSSLSIEALGANAGTVLSDAIRIALQQAYKIDNDNGSARVLEVEAYTCKEQFVDKKMTAAKSDSPLATDYSPLPFINIRNMFGVSKVEYQSSLCDRPLVGSDGGAGASGSVFFLSADNKYIIKSLPKSEADKLREILKPYHQHMLRHKESLLPKFFGLYKLKMGTSFNLSCHSFRITKNAGCKFSHNTCVSNSPSAVAKWRGEVIFFIRRFHRRRDEASS